MRNGITVCITGTLMVLGGVGAAIPAEQSGSAYHSIVDRNVFGLKAPPPPPDPEATKPPPSKITLQGITTLLGRKLVLMKVMVPGNKPGAKSEEVPLTLTVGQKQEDVEVLEIHEEEPKWVKVNNSGVIVSLNFKDNGVNLATAAPPPPPGVQPRPGMAIPPPPGAQPAFPTYTPQPTYQPRTIPRTRGVSSTGGPSYPPPVAPQSYYSAVPNASGVASPNTAGAVALNGLGAPASAVQPSKNWPPEVALTPEQSAIMEAAYTMKYQKQIQAGSMPSIPGSNPILDGANPQQQQMPPSRF
jgi:hypothetical protein